MEKEKDGPYDFDKKFEFIDNQLQDQEKRRTRQLDYREAIANRGGGI